MLIQLVGRSAVQAQDQQWSDHAALNVPFLTTRELFLLKEPTTRYWRTGT